MERTFSFEARAVVPTTQGLTSDTPERGKNQDESDKQPERHGIAHRSQPRRADRSDQKIGNASRMRYAIERARRKPSRSAAAPPKIARNHTMPPKMPVSVPVCSVEKFSFSCRYSASEAKPRNKTAARKSR